MTLVLAVLILAALVLAVLATGAEVLLGVLLALLDLVAELATMQNEGQLGPTARAARSIGG